MITQAQIEAALKAANKVRLGAGDDRMQIEAALAAAAEVGEPKLEDFGFNTQELLAEQCKETMGKLIAAEKRIKELEASIEEYACTSTDKAMRLLQDKNIIAAVIERCAQVAENEADKLFAAIKQNGDDGTLQGRASVAFTIYHAIRALKDS